jgi:hypothetical protein
MIPSNCSQWFRFCFAVIASAMLALPAAYCGDRVPVKSSLTGYTVSRETIGDPLNFGVPFAEVVNEAQGTASHSGRIHIVSRYLLKLVIENGIPIVIGEGTYITTTANGTVWNGTFVLRQPLGQSAFTFEAMEDSGAILHGIGESLPNGTFSYKTRGTLPNPGHNR